MSETARPDHWMVRTRKNEILGPFTKETLISQIRNHQVSLEDEICQANHYWIYLDERDEVLKQLGIESPRPHSPNDEEEVTATETLTVDAPLEKASSERIQSESKDFAPDDVRKTYLPPGHVRIGKPQVFGRVEKSLFMRLLISLLVILMGGLVAWVIRILGR